MLQHIDKALLFCASDKGLAAHAVLTNHGCVDTAYTVDCLAVLHTGWVHHAFLGVNGTEACRELQGQHTPVCPSELQCF